MFVFYCQLQQRIHPFPATRQHLLVVITVMLTVSLTCFSLFVKRVVYTSTFSLTICFAKETCLSGQNIFGEIHCPRQVLFNFPAVSSLLQRWKLSRNKQDLTWPRSFLLMHRDHNGVKNVGCGPLYFSLICPIHGQFSRYDKFSLTRLFVKN